MLSKFVATLPFLGLFIAAALAMGFIQTVIVFLFAGAIVLTVFGCLELSEYLRKKGL